MTQWYEDDDFASLRPSGTVVIDVVGKELAGRRTDRVLDLPDGSTCIQRVRLIDDCTIMDSEFIVIRGSSARRFPITHRVYSGLELRLAMESVGFHVRLFGDFNGRRYATDSRRLVAISRKPV